MWLFNEPVDEFAAKGMSLDEMATGLRTALEYGVDPLKTGFETLTGMEVIAKTLQRTIGSGLVGNSEQFREKMFRVYEETSKIGATFEDVSNVMLGLYSGLDKMVEPSEKVTQQMVYLHQTTGMEAKALGGLVSDFMRLTFSQEKSGELIKKITDSARKGGVSVSASLTNFQKTFKQVNAYGFKNGVDGLNKMNVQAMQLRTTVEEIGAAQLGQTFWDPEKAIEAAAGMSMLGGAIGGLGNPFQLMNMGANNVEKLQEELINLSASAYKINETTGEVETNFIAQQRLKGQLDTLGKGGEYEKFINLGKEAAKQKMILDDLSKSGLGNLFEGEGKTFTEEDKKLIASLSEVKDGKVSLNIPGLDKPIDDLKGALSSDTTAKAIKSALEEYQNTVNQSEKDIAIKGLTVAENQAIDVKIIREALLRNMTEQQRTNFLKTVQTGQQMTSTTTQKIANTGAAVVGDGIQYLNTIFNLLNEKIETRGVPVASTPTELNRVGDGFFDDGTKTLSMGKGEMFNFIKEDQAVFAPDLDEKLGILKDSYMKMKDFENSALSQIVPKELPEVKLPRTESTQKTEVTETKVQKIEGSGSVNINVNITSSGNLADTLINDRRFKNDLEKEILYVIKNKDLLMVKKP
jgi:hypothetical protein